MDLAPGVMFEFMEIMDVKEVVIGKVHQVSCKAPIGTIESQTAFVQQWYILRQAGDTKLDPGG